MSMYKYIRKAWQRPKENLGSLWKERLMQWRREPVTIRLERPTRIDRARSLGYKAKEGFMVVRQRVLRGGHVRPHVLGGRRPKHSHHRMALRKNYQLLAEERAQRKYHNLVVLNSYWVAKDGKNYWFEIIMVDPEHPQIKADERINWICKGKNRTRVFHGQTAAGKKMRGLRWKGRGSEKARPSKAKYW